MSRSLSTGSHSAFDVFEPRRIANNAAHRHPGGGSHFGDRFVETLLVAS
ncbi:MAG: hypothetical protein HYX77_02770 [Acidobacteria bacterium]|nr:hypothetical protein [Acidobacteriota bacterium]